MSKVWLRLDCDNPIYHSGPADVRSYLNYLSLKLSVRMFKMHNKPLMETKSFLQGYDISRVWFFRPLTCPDCWDEPFGLHATYKDEKRFGEELEVVESKLGKVVLFTRHGFAPLKSGSEWSDEEIKVIEEVFCVRDLSAIPHYTVGSGQILDLNVQRYVLFHPCHLYRHGKELAKVLDEAIRWNNGK